MKNMAEMKFHLMEEEEDELYGTVLASIMRRKS